ncbi:MAG: hypothetical protein KDA60_06200 [Planctomycetales bacterium]|nr:hypothetical protein [Planctomycetales bacterium]
MRSRSTLRIMAAAVSTAAASLTFVSTERTIEAGEHMTHGQCVYCMDGTCTPRRETWGFYAPRWREWPLGPHGPVLPSHASPPRQWNGTDGGPLDVPTTDDESSYDPELPGASAESSIMVPLSPAPDMIDDGDGETPSDPFSDESASTPRRLPNPYMTASQLQPLPHSANPIRATGLTSAQVEAMGSVRQTALVQPVGGSAVANPLRSVGPPVADPSVRAVAPASLNDSLTTLGSASTGGKAVAIPSTIPVGGYPLQVLTPQTRPATLARPLPAPSSPPAKSAQGTSKPATNNPLR